MANPNPAAVDVRLQGRDARGRPTHTVAFQLRAGAAALISSQQLEAGDPSFSGSFGDGAGKWRLAAWTSTRDPIEVMSLLRTASGHLTNVSW